MPEFSRRVDVDIIKDEPQTFNAFVHDRLPEDAATVDGNVLDELAAGHREYVGAFQPYRWRATAANGEPVAHGESYFNEADAINAVELLFGDDTTMYWRSREPERGDQLLRFGKTDRDSQ